MILSEFSATISTMGVFFVMKRLKSYLIALGLIIIALLIIFLRQGVGFHIFGEYEKADQYTTGGGKISIPFKSVEISWVSGRINIETSKDIHATFTESSNQKLNKHQTMHWLLDGDTLRIKACESSLNGIALPQKDLTLTLPETLDLEEVKISVVSADTKVHDLKADSLAFNSTSGSLSGDARIGALKTSTVSGNVDLNAGSLQTISTGTTSGQIKLKLDTVPETISSNSVSGDVELNFPTDANFCVNFHSVSGDLKTSIPNVKEEKTHRFGSGGPTYAIESVSGDLTIQ